MHHFLTLYNLTARSHDLGKSYVHFESYEIGKLIQVLKMEISLHWKCKINFTKDSAFSFKNAWQPLWNSHTYFHDQIEKLTQMRYHLLLYLIWCLGNRPQSFAENQLYKYMSTSVCTVCIYFLGYVCKKIGTENHFVLFYESPWFVKIFPN